MAAAIQTEPVPLRADENGVFRVGDSQVLLDAVIDAFKAGAAPEEIALAYDSLRLEDIYLVVGYYLRHRTEIDAYMVAREGEAAKNKARADAQLPWAELRGRLLARRQGH